MTAVKRDPLGAPPVGAAVQVGYALLDRKHGGGGINAGNVPMT